MYLKLYPKLVFLDFAFLGTTSWDSLPTYGSRMRSTAQRNTFWRMAMGCTCEFARLARSGSIATCTAGKTSSWRLADIQLFRWRGHVGRPERKWSGERAG